VRKSNFKPQVVYDAMGFIRLHWLVAERNGEDITLLISDTTRFEVHTREVLAGQVGPLGAGTRYVLSDYPVEALALGYKAKALSYGATSQAMRLLGTLVPLSEEDLNTMAEKLKVKGGAAETDEKPKRARAKGDAAALKEAAKETPVAGKRGKASAAPAEPAKKRGNLEALEKARAAGNAAREENRKKKITLVEKTNPKREGSKAFTNYALYRTSKTVGDFLDAGGTMADVRYDSNKGFITLS